MRRLLLKEAKSSLGEAEWGEPDLEAYTQFCSAAEEARTTPHPDTSHLFAAVLRISRSLRTTVGLMFLLSRLWS